MSDWRALRVGESVRERRALLELAHETFVTDGANNPEARAKLSLLRPVVLASWLRSQKRTIDPDHAPQQASLTRAALDDVLATHPIGKVLPVVQRLLLEEANDSGFIIAVGDAAGRLLWVDGDHTLRSRAEDMGFAAGVDWSEEAVGTSAPGSAIAINHSIQVLGAEHYARAVHEWSCTAAPVHDPESGAILGVIDVTGGDGAASPHLMPLVEATVAAVHAELKLASLRALIDAERQLPAVRVMMTGATGAKIGEGAGGATGATPTAVSVGTGAGADDAAGSAGRRLTVGTGQRSPRQASQRQLAPRLVALGRDPALLEHAGGTHPIGGRHSEILLALAASPRGRSAAQLTDDVYGEEGTEQTLRAEIVRLRRWLAAAGIAIEIASRPYRLDVPLRVDALEALEALQRGAHRLALAAYEGPLMPVSDAPVAVRLRGEVDATLREALLQSAAAEPLFDYAQNWALTDAEVWQTLLQVLPPLSPKRARVVAKLAEIAALA
ncbi:hypothetical protein JOF28_000828 [Leucobacter exalbidus]|uniref:GAF domain-containing protein n=1 Tax=Leucobacter exalbidus TaxID=662960 RepID=A0A940PUQ7_9MICO|nr:transcriptional regulator [Leucobacter exalbidus]MBP1325596.1 hypothetical protein [Leucobacter exalbidus]